MVFKVLCNCLVSFLEIMIDIPMRVAEGSVRRISGVAENEVTSLAKFPRKICVTLFTTGQVYEESLFGTKPSVGVLANQPVLLLQVVEDHWGNRGSRPQNGLEDL